MREEVPAGHYARVRHEAGGTDCVAARTEKLILKMKTLTLYELNGLVRGALESALQEQYWVQAELSEVHEAYNGHCYMEFVQKAKNGRDLVAKARGIVWAETYGLLKPAFEKATGRPLSRGIKVLVKVEVNFHELYGYSLNVRDIDPTYTLGDIERLRREILEKLEAAGILNDNKGIPLPRSANRIAVISSATAAGYGDFRNQLLRNEYRLRFTVKLFPAVMQGERVEKTVLDALNLIAAERDNWDAVVIIRGGGATSDLSGFDSYPLSEACAQFPLPVITGIGHDRDETVLDFVAHTRVKTPTAAAAFLVGHQSAEAARIEEAARAIRESAGERMEGERQRLVRLSLRLASVVSQVRAGREHRLAQLASLLAQACRQRLSGERHKMEIIDGKLAGATAARMERERFRLQLLRQRVEAADPVLLLRRGYSMTFVGGKLARRASELKKGDEITTRLAEGEVRSVVQ